jgi:hypothetical protein
LKKHLSISSQVDTLKEKKEELLELKRKQAQDIKARGFTKKTIIDFVPTSLFAKSVGNTKFTIF